MDAEVIRREIKTVWCSCGCRMDQTEAMLAWACADCGTVFNPVFDLVVIANREQRVVSPIRWARQVRD